MQGKDLPKSRENLTLNWINERPEGFLEKFYA
jgi:hypothetical protein